MDDRKTRINPPLYLAYTIIFCWRCGSDIPAVGLIAPNVPDTGGEVCILSNITELPMSVLGFVQNRFPSFKRKHSKAIESEYYANTCPNCGVLSGDFFLHSEPGSPFFPESKEDAASLTVEEIPIKGPIEVEAGLSMGCGDLILEHGKKGSLKQPTPPYSVPRGGHLKGELGCPVPRRTMKAEQDRGVFPERKISETFLDFAAPLLSAVPKGANKREYESVLKIAFIVWNSVVYADATNDDRHLSEMRRLVGQDGQSRLICEQMISRKRELFGKDYRLVGDHRITMEKGGFRLWAEARTPYPDNGKKAAPPSAGDPSTRTAADLGASKK